MFINSTIIRTFVLLADRLLILIFSGQKEIYLNFTFLDFLIFFNYFVFILSFTLLCSLCQQRAKTFSISYPFTRPEPLTVRLKPMTTRWFLIWHSILIKPPLAFFAKNLTKGMANWLSINSSSWPKDISNFGSLISQIVKSASSDSWLSSSMKSILTATVIWNGRSSQIT